MMKYTSPLVGRYASDYMASIFGPHYRAVTWRFLWLDLARIQHELGLPITKDQLDLLADNIEPIIWERIEELEKELRHDVMAHLHAWGELVPEAKGILHMGATSCFITDNADLLIMRDGLHRLRQDVALCLKNLGFLAPLTIDDLCLGYTHLQPAQPTVLGKRIAGWAQDLFEDLKALDAILKSYKLRGLKGATGTQASFLQLFGSKELVDKADQMFAEYHDCKGTYTVTGQTYPRKFDTRVASVLSGIAVSLHKMATDIRLLAGFGELVERQGNRQVGSSAMPHKNNPIISERICSLARHLMTLSTETMHTAANQWLERSLDDSACRRLTIPEMFLTADAILNLTYKLTSSLEVKPKMEERLDEFSVFTRLEPVIMEMVKEGADRQEVHERLRVHVREAGGGSALLDRISADPFFSCRIPPLSVGLAREQVTALFDEIQVYESVHSRRES